MDERRDGILRRIRLSKSPVTGGALAKELGVSRQVIVQDIAVLRAMGHGIIATPAGYILPSASIVADCVRVLCCTHVGDDDMRRELLCVVRHGGTVRDVVVEHPVYGEFRAMLMLETEADVSRFMHSIAQSDAAPLSTLTGGSHLHTVSAPCETALDDMQAELRQLGVLVEE